MSVTTFPSVSFAEIVGKRQILNLPNLGAGSEWSFTCPGGYYYRILGGSGTLTISAVVGNRAPGIQLTDGTNLLGAVWTTVNSVAGSTVQVLYEGGASWSATGVANLWQQLNIPSIWLPPTYVIQSNTRGLQAGDTYTNLVLWLEQLEIGARGLPMGRHEPTIAEEEELYGVG